MEVLNLTRLFWRWVSPYISRIYTAYIGEDSSILDTNDMFGDLTYPIPLPFLGPNAFLPRQVCVFIGWALAQSSGGAKDLQKCFDAPRHFWREDKPHGKFIENTGMWKGIHDKNWRKNTLLEEVSLVLRDILITVDPSSTGHGSVKNGCISNSN